MKFEERIYLDYAASTPVDKRVFEAMRPYFSEYYGNPSSIHFLGQKSEGAIEEARRIIAEIIGAKKEEIIFTSCGSESDNLALRGVCLRQNKLFGKSHLLVSPVEHPAVIQTARHLSNENGFDLELLPVDEYGLVDPDNVEERIREDTALVSVVYANNEIGTVNPIAEIGNVCKKHQVPFHTDAVQAAAHIYLDVERDNIDLMALGAHKFYGPKGIGVLFVREGTEIMPVITGGKQEKGLRAGTHNVPYIVGMAEALRLSASERENNNAHIQPMRDFIINGILGKIPSTKLTGHPIQRLPNHASFVFEGVDGNYLLSLLDMAGFACSSGSACKIGSPSPSEILLALGIPSNWALGSLRITLGKFTSQKEIDGLLEILPGLVEKSR